MKIRTLILCVFLSAMSVALGQEYTQMSDLPTLYIETENRAQIPSKNEKYIRAVLTLVDGGKVTVYNELGIRGRGNSTWGLPKKPYRIKFDSKQEFLGKNRAKAKSWTLLANHSDKTLMRNAVASCIGDFAGQPFTAAAEFVDVVLNGQYVGNYQISDQIEIRKKRVDITEQEDEGMTENDNISGGYLLEVDGFADQEVSNFTTRRGVKITIKSPDEEIISKAQTNYITNYINNFETALFSSNFKDPETGYRQYVDAETLASWYIASELTGNPDCFWSTYIYKEKDDPKIYWGPLWDYDIAFNNCVRKGNIANTLMIDGGFHNGLTEVWIKQMWLDPWFANLINNKWKELVEEGIEQHVVDFIDATAAKLEQSQRLNFGVWPINQRAYDEYMLFTTYSAGVDFLRNYVRNRVSFLTTAFASRAAAVTPPEPLDADPTYFYTITSKAVSKRADVSNQALCIWQSNSARNSQYWRFVADGSGNYMIINRESELAVTTTASGTQLTLSTPDITNQSQLWKIAPANNSPGMGMIIESCQNGLAWNNNAGLSTDGNSIISWDSDSQNPDKPNRQWYIDITKERYIIEAASVALDKPTLSLKEGQSETLRATVLPENTTDKTVVWTVDDASVATVADGLVTAVKRGETRVTATCGNASASCTVTVAPEYSVEGIVLSLDEFSIAEGAAPMELTAAVTPAEATYPELTWSVEPAGIVELRNEGAAGVIVAPLGAGEATITATATDGSGVSANCAVSVVKITALELAVDEEDGDLFSDGTLKMCIGTEAGISVTAVPATDFGPELQWSVTDAKVVGINANGSVGKLSGLAVGETDLRVELANDAAVAAVARIVIYAPVEDIDLGLDEFSIAEGAAPMELTAAVTPAEATYPELTWSVEPAGIVELRNESAAGVTVAPLGAGEATITAAATDGSGVSANCAVSVVKITALELAVDEENGDIFSDGTLKMYIGLEPAVNVAAVPATDFGPELRWSVTDESVVGINANGSVGKLSGLAVGETDLRVELANDGAVAAVARIVVHKDASVADLIADDRDTIDVYNIAGQPVILNGRVEQLKSLSKGFYIVRNGSKAHPVMIKN